MDGKLDLKRAEKAYFSAPAGEFGEGTFLPYQYLMIDGQGSLGDSVEYAAALAALYPLAYAAARAGKPNTDTSAVRLGQHADGRCLSILHLGPFADEAAVLHRLHHEVMPARGLTFNGEHHEIYLSDPRRTPPEKLRTILRQPVRPR